MKVVRALVGRVRSIMQHESASHRAMEIARAQREATDAEAKLDRCLHNALRHNPCAAAVLDIGRALRNGHDLENLPARRREGDDP